MGDSHVGESYEIRNRQSMGGSFKNMWWIIDYRGAQYAPGLSVDDTDIQ